VAGSCEYGDEPSGSGATELVIISQDSFAEFFYSLSCTIITIEKASSNKSVFTVRKTPCIIATSHDNGPVDFACCCYSNPPSAHLFKCRFRSNSLSLLMKISRA
jgi:hypothetical protein